MLSIFDVNLVCYIEELLYASAYRRAVLARVYNLAVAGINNLTNATFRITDIKLYVPVATLSTQDDNNLLKQVKTGFKTTIKWNK